ncbi:hypothetical protein E4U15_006534 [Claviceps sp. LM218 group G6]|nr:hypothetical protein E4U15_006534 [Claviceps sp. LM218 group G6]
MDLDPSSQSTKRAVRASSLSSTSTSTSRSSTSTSDGLEESGAAAPHDGGDGSDSPAMSRNRGPSHQQQPQKHGYERERQHDTGHDAAAAAAAAAAEAHAKKLRACEACRALKVRCEPDPNPNPGDDNAPCKRCKKAGRKCVVTVPTRKRQKKTDSRVSELERKIDALTASLQARGAVPIMAATATPSGQRPTKMASSSSEALPGLSNTSDLRHTRGATASPRPQQSHTPRPSSYRSSVFDHPPDAATGQKRKATSDYIDGCMDDSKAGSPATGGRASQWPSPSPGRAGQRCDIIDRGIISTETAAALFQRYKQHMLPHLPAVVFPPNLSVMELRRSKPYLFLAVMAAASSETLAVQQMLQKELLELFAEKIIIVGEKNLELVQALQVAVIWYWPPDHFEELKFYQLVHMAAVMALDIGLGKKKASPSSAAAWSCSSSPSPLPNNCGGGSAMSMGGTWREQLPRRQPPPDPTSLECRRAWLTCHFLAANTAMSLHRPHLIRWTPFMTESLKLLRSCSAPGAVGTDPYFCHLVWTHRMAEDIGVQLSMDDADAGVSIVDEATQRTLRGLEGELERYIGTVPADMMQPSLKMGFCILNLYMHELVLHSDGCTETAQSQQSFSNNANNIVQDAIASSDGMSSNTSHMSTTPCSYTSNPSSYTTNNTAAATPAQREAFSAAHINALTACLTAIDSTFQTFLAMDVLSIRCLPVFTFVRIAYAVVILMKMYFSASNPTSELGQVIHRDRIRVAHYLEALLEKFNATAADEKCRPASKFLLVLVMLRTWFLKHGKGEASAATTGGATPAAARQHETPPQPQQHPEQEDPHKQQYQREYQQYQQHLRHHQLQQKRQQQQQQQQQQHQHRQYHQSPQDPPRQHYPQHQPQHQYQSQRSSSPASATTPLRVLSEVATGREPTPRPTTTFCPPPPIPPHLLGPLSPSKTTPYFQASPPYYQASTPLSDIPPPPPPPPLPPPPQQPQQQQWITQPPGPDPGAGPGPVPFPDMTIGFPAGFDFEALGVPLDGSGEMYGGGAKMVLNDPLFSDMFQGLPDPTFFDF